MTGSAANAPALTDGWLYANWSRLIFEQMRAGGLTARFHAKLLAITRDFYIAGCW